MSNRWKVVLALNALLLLWNAIHLFNRLAVVGYAQRAPQTNEDGVPFLKVNINPTNVAPFVDINPNRVVPQVEVVRMPPISVEARGCEDGRNFQTSIGRSIPGPMVVTYLNLPEKSVITLVDGNGQSQRVPMAASTQLTTALYLKTGQHLEFTDDVLYSGCRVN